MGTRGALRRGRRLILRFDHLNSKEWTRKSPELAGVPAGSPTSCLARTSWHLFSNHCQSSGRFDFYQLVSSWLATHKLLGICFGKTLPWLWFWVYGTKYHPSTYMQIFFTAHMFQIFLLYLVAPNILLPSMCTKYFVLPMCTKYFCSLQVHQAPGHYRAPSPGTYHQAPHQVVARLIYDQMSDLDIVQNVYNKMLITLRKFLQGHQGQHSPGPLSPMGRSFDFCYNSSS